ncbi:GumC family protein [Sphingobium subterraneum]|uniref:Uncharacterized protein involved in exopolysaccharide biosynthesis n=1 Tax=Sphingobium subterraneum TaxID=627688 RepID=A0A841IYZ1_9SPHN|nr:Wzz/FepE/Etk N-terminal domain-containing protein [Sphingobium subterraneum]MBB6122496.1 uncharacterized protein involved in exopolysaccharide biosynthesis [Sphingobium subterraneum]
MNSYLDVSDRIEAQVEGGSLLSHIPAILKQRKWFLIIPAIVFALVGVVAAFVLPVKYQSRAVLLVEAPLLPEAVTDADTSGVVDQRMAKIRQQVMSRPQLIELIQTNGLYSDELRRSSLSEVIEQMRGSIQIDPVTAEIQQAGSGRKSTIAFSMQYLYSDPVKAQAVAQALTERVLEIDSTATAEQAANTVQFLTDQAADVQAQISVLETQISGIKARNGSVLSSAGMTMIGGNSGSYDAQIAALQRDNSVLNSQRSMARTSADRDPVVSSAEAALASARASYSESHPDVVLAKQRLAEARRLASSNQTKQPVDDINEQIAFNNRQIAALQSARAQDSARMSAAMGAQSKAPVVTEQIAQLQQRLDTLYSQYQGISGRLLNAQAGKKAEDSQQGERLSVIDPPVVPDKPISPNRPMLMAGGLAGGLGLGLMLVLGIEILLRPIRDVDALQEILGEPPLVVVPTVRALKEQKLAWYRRLWPFGRREKMA